MSDLIESNLPIGSAHEGALRPRIARRLSSTVYNEVKLAILTGKYKPDSWLSVDDLRDEFGVSRQPVMEAMRRLSGEWLVEILPQVGCRVASYSKRDLREFIDTFGEMEGALAALAAQRRTDEQMKRLQSVYGGLKTLKVYGTERIDRCREFHNVLLEMAHSDALARVCMQMWEFGQFAVAIVDAARLDKRIKRAIRIQQRLVDALEKKDARAARTHLVSWLT